MGINANVLRFVLGAKRAGVDFSSTATLGRQGIHMTYSKFASIVNKEFDMGFPPHTLKTIYDSKYADSLLIQLGAREVHSFDASDYEGATHVHDFNNEIDQSMFNRYSVVVDGGSLEHIFNVPTGLRNCMQMLVAGGYYIGVSPTNNNMGHGFYQFSPELFFRVFSEENGFSLLRMYMYEDRNSRRWFNVSDPESIESRVGLVNYSASDLMILARKQRHELPLSVAPQQSDYQSAWSSEHPVKSREAPISKFLRTNMPAWLKIFAKTATFRLRNPRMFKPVTPEDLATLRAQIEHR